MRNPPMTREQQSKALDMIANGLNDKQVADRVGVHRQAVGRLRRKGFIAPQGPPRFMPAEAQLAELHSHSNNEMQRRYGTATDTWAAVRKRYGIPNFRPPTTVQGVPQLIGRKEAPVRKPVVGRVAMAFDCFVPSPLPPRDSSLAGCVAEFFRGKGYSNVYNRQKVLGKPGWQVGRNVLDEQSMIAKARDMGFSQQEYAL